MGNFLTPDAFVRTIHSVSPDNLRTNGICGLILDIDNTLVPTHTRDADIKIEEYMRSLRTGGIQAVVVSNAKKERVERFCRSLGVSFVYKALKPFRRGYREAMRIMGLPPDRIAIAGDQLFTDILGGNLLGMKTILIQPIDPHEPFFIRLKRILEKPFLRNTVFHDDLIIR